MHKSVDRNAICDADANFPMQKARPSDGSGPRVAARIHPAGMQLRKFFVPATDVGVGRAFRHFAAMLLTLTVIGHLIKRHGHSFYKRQLNKLSPAPCSRTVTPVMEP